MSSASGSNTGAAAAGEAAASAKAPLKPIQVKLVLLGEAAVGKSSLVLRFVNNEFVDNKEPTIGAAFLTQKCKLQDKIIKFEIWYVFSLYSLMRPLSLFSLLVILYIPS